MQEPSEWLENGDVTVFCDFWNSDAIDLLQVMKKIVECGHTVKMRCYQEAKRRFCTQSCECLAPCGHQCKAVCSERCGTVKCRVRVRKEGVKALCGHDFVNVMCHERDNGNLRLTNLFFFLNEGEFTKASNYKPRWKINALRC